MTDLEVPYYWHSDVDFLESIGFDIPESEQIIDHGKRYRPPPPMGEYIIVVM